MGIHSTLRLGHRFGILDETVSPLSTAVALATGTLGTSACAKGPRNQILGLYSYKGHIYGYTGNYKDTQGYGGICSVTVR